jgi:hypothetical protein
MRKLAFCAPVLLLACAAHQKTVVGIDQVPPGSKCTESAVLKSFIGQPASAALAAQMMAASTSRNLRWVAAGAAMTMEYSPTRLTVQLDSGNRIASLRCG